MTTRSTNRALVGMPLAAVTAGGGALLLAILALTALLGSASAGASCTQTNGPGQPVTGAPAKLQPIFNAAAERYQLGPQGPSILAGLTSVESGFGQNMGPSSAGAIGWTQFMPATWAAYGVDANGDGRKDPYTAEDAIFASARYLRASGAPDDWYRALFAYNHADWYVTKVLDRARELQQNGPVTAQDSNSIRVLIVGDSLAVGTLPHLRDTPGLDLTADVVTGRSSAAGISILRSQPLAAFDVVVFDLGTNDGSVGELRRSLGELALIAADKRLVLATLSSPYDEAAKNSLLRRYAQRHPQVSLVAWHERSQALDLPDGVHGGYPARAQLFAEALAAPASPGGGCEAVANGPGVVQRVEGGGTVVAIAGQPGEFIDSRILDDVVYLLETYRITITDGYALTGHAADGEHPLGLALDIVPGPGGSWDDVDRLARWAEPAQNAPRPPFRWVGYDGDSNHGRGHHLHLSWDHGPAPTQRPPAPWVQTFSTAS